MQPSVFPPCHSVIVRSAICYCAPAIMGAKCTLAEGGSGARRIIRGAAGVTHIYVIYVMGCAQSLKSIQ